MVDYQKRRNIIKVLGSSMALLEIISSFYLKQIFVFFNIHMESNVFLTFKYVLLALGIFDLLRFSIFFKFKASPQKQ